MATPTATGALGKRREYYSRTAQIHCATWTETACAIVIYWISFTLSLQATIFKASRYFVVIFLGCEVFQRIPRIHAAVILNLKLCSDTFFTLTKYKKHMHCQKRLSWGKTPAALAQFPHSEFLHWCKDNCVEHNLLFKKLLFQKKSTTCAPTGPKEPVFKAVYLGSNVS